VKLSAIQGGDGEDVEPSNFLGHRQHNDGDGTSGSSHGTSSPDSFRDAATVLKATDQRREKPLTPAAATETNDDVIVTHQDFLAGIRTNSWFNLANCYY